MKTSNVVALYILQGRRTPSTVVRFILSGRK